MSFKIQQGQVEGLRQAFANMAADLSATGADLTASIEYVETTLTNLINASGNYLYEYIDEVDTTLTANLLLTGLTLNNRINLLPDQTDFDDMQDQIDVHDEQIDLISGRFSTLTGQVTGISGVVTGLVFQVSALTGITGQLMPVLGKGSTPYVGNFYHRVDGTISLSGDSTLDLMSDAEMTMATLNTSDLNINSSNDLLFTASGDVSFDLNSGNFSILDTEQIRLWRNENFSITNINGGTVFNIDDDGVVITCTGSTPSFSVGYLLGNGVFNGGNLSVNLNEPFLGGFGLDTNGPVSMVGDGDLTLQGKNGDIEITGVGGLGIDSHGPVDFHSDTGIDITAAGDLDLNSANYTLYTTATRVEMDATDRNLYLYSNSGVTLNAAKIQFLSIPASDPGVVGAIWRDGDFLKISH